jgi:probable F420-dependent oxidoreductase
LPLAELPALARRAEQLGYTDAWSFEVNGYDGFSPLAATAAVTERMRLGTAIVPVYTRPPGLIAMQAAALAALAPGRFVLGLGASTPTVVESWLGVPFQRPLTRTTATLKAVRALLAGEKVDGMRLATPPSPPPPIFMAALGEKMLQAAGELADGVCFFMCGPAIIGKLLERTGRQMDSVERLIVLPGGEEAMSAARRFLVTYALVPFYARVMKEQGFGAEIDAIHARWQAGERAAAPGQVSDAMVDELVLAGSTEHIGERLDAYGKAGLGTAALSVAGADRPALERLLESLRASSSTGP